MLQIRISNSDKLNFCSSKAQPFSEPSYENGQLSLILLDRAIVKSESEMNGPKKPISNMGSSLARLRGIKLL